VTPDERSALRRLLAWHRSRKLTTTGRGAASPGVDVVHELAPEVYVARTPAGGIPALSEGATTWGGTGTNTHAGTGTELLEDDAPGYADDVQLWRLTDAHAAVPTLEPYDLGFTKRVFNLSTTAVAGNRWVVVKRDKSGAWWVETGAGGGSVNVCGNPDPLTTNASGSGTDTAGHCPTRTDHELLHTGVTQIKFASDDFRVTSGGDCGAGGDAGGTGTGTGTQLTDGKVTVHTVGHTGAIQFGRGDPIICDTDCQVYETLRYLCVVDGLVQGYYDGVEAIDRCMGVT
jgi:hypothetical protein